MYAFIDRPVDSLDNSGRFLLWAMRGWTRVAGDGRCPPQALRRGFAATHAQHALPDFHVAMAMLTGEALAMMTMAPMPCRRIGEDEAILLGLWQRVAQGDEAGANATLALLVAPDAVGPVAHAMRAAVAGLTEAGFDPSILAAPYHATSGKTDS